MKAGVPVLMHHSVGYRDPRWMWNYLTCPMTEFEDQLRWIQKKGFSTISLQELYDHMSRGVSIPRKSAVLTFDDGYLDNWVYAYPLLKKYQMKATIYVSPEFADPRNFCRKNLDDLKPGEDASGLERTGYLSWEEMKEMDEDGTIDIQSHSMTHTWYPINDKIIDYRFPKDPYLWMTWNRYPSEKFKLQIDAPDLIDYGSPVYDNGRAIGIRRYFPDEGLEKHLIEYSKNMGSDFFRSKSWRDVLERASSEYRARNDTSGKYESNEEYESRLLYELKASKDLLEKKLKKEVLFLCWPGGSVSPRALEVAHESGYISSTAAGDLGDRRRLRNVTGEDPSRVNRIGATLYWDGVEGPGSRIKYLDGRNLMRYFNAFRMSGHFAFPSKVLLHSSHICYKYLYR